MIFMALVAVFQNNEETLKFNGMVKVSKVTCCM